MFLVSVALIRRFYRVILYDQRQENGCSGLKSILRTTSGIKYVTGIDKPYDEVDYKLMRFT